jgi:hypothetical protein
MNPKTVETIRYRTVLRPKPTRAPVTSGLVCPASRIRSGKPLASRVMKNSTTMTKARLEKTPRNPDSQPCRTSNNEPRSILRRAASIWSVPTPRPASQFRTSVTISSNLSS